MEDWATEMSPGPTNESGQELEFQIVSNSNEDLFSVGPAVDSSTGDLTYTPAANANGVATIHLVLVDDGGTANGGVDTSQQQTFTITVDAVEDLPVVTASEKTVAEGTVLEFTASAFTSHFSDPDVGDALVTVQITAVPTHGALKLDGVAVEADDEVALEDLGKLTYEAEPDYTGEDTFQWKATDGAEYSEDAATVTITVAAVNDLAPYLTISGDEAVVEGVSYTLTLGEVVAPGQTTVDSYTINWGDSNSDTYSAEYVSQHDREVTHVYSSGAMRRH